MTRGGAADCEEGGSGAGGTLCMQAGAGAGARCPGEMMAGHGLFCPGPAGWRLTGVSAWRRGCGRVGERPRQYERVELAAAWAQGVIEQDRASTAAVPRRRLG